MLPLRRLLFLALIAALLVAPPASARGFIIRVGLLFEADACRISSSDGLEAANRDGQPLARLGDAVVVTAGPADGVVVSGAAFPDTALMLRARNGAISLNGRWYRGQMVVLRTATGRLNVVNYVDVESYIQGVLAGEVPCSWPEECLKAQAVAARSYVLYQMDRYGGRDWDVVATDKDQVYDGMEGEVPSIVRAVQATKGEVIAYDGKTVKAFFHSACGGHTEDAESVFGEAAPFLRGVPDPYCGQSPYQSWTREYTMQRVRRALSQGRRSPLGKLLEVKLSRRGPSGRVHELILVREGGEERLAGTELRRLLGYRDLRSTLFDIEVKKSVSVSLSAIHSEFVTVGRDGSEESDIGLERDELVSAVLRPEQAFIIIAGTGALEKARAGYAYAATAAGILRTFAMRPGLEVIGLAHRLVTPSPARPVRKERRVTTRTTQRQVPILFTFRGRGWGHGVGMCQWGARGMAAQGVDYRAILSHYYPQTRLMIITN